MIYTLTLNPAVDYIMHPAALIAGETNRSTREEVAFGGKGINVSLVLKELSVESTALGFVGGFTGAALEAHLQNAGIRTDFVHLAAGMTRINVKVKTDENDILRETEINGAGPTVSANELNALYRKLDSLSDGDTLVLSGSIPASLPDQVYGAILMRLSSRRIQVAADTRHRAMTYILPYRPFVIKPNRQELSEMVGRPLSTDRDTEHAAREIQAKGAQNVLVSLGRDGALLLDEHGYIHRAPAVGGRPLNTVGAGDSMLAGYLAGIVKGQGYALSLALAAGGATATSIALADRRAILSLFGRQDKNNESR